MASNFELANVAMGGRLVESLTAWREEGLTIDRITQRLETQGIGVSRETVRRWLQSLEGAA